MAQLNTDQDDNGDLALTVDFDDSDYEAPRVSVRVNYRHVPDLAAEQPDVADDPTWDPEDAEAWHFQVEGRAVEHDTWSVLMEGYCDAFQKQQPSQSTSSTRSSRYSPGDPCSIAWTDRRKRSPTLSQAPSTSKSATPTSSPPR